MSNALLNVLLLVFTLQTMLCHNYEYDNWKFHFLPGSGMGLFIAVALPIDLPNKNVYLAYNFEANYILPDNQTLFNYPPLVQRSIDRQLIYTALETKIKSNGYPGKACLLRLICESNLKSVNHANGVLGDILHIIFTPSSSKNVDLPTEYELAEISGKHKDCKNFNKKCTVSFLDLITWVGHSI